MYNRFFPNFVKIWLQNCPNPPKTPPNPPQILPKSTPNRSKGPLDDHVGPVLAKSWIFIGQQNGQETPQSGQEAPKRGQEAPRSLPKPSQMEPRTLPNRLFRSFVGLYFPTPYSYRFFIHVLSFFLDFLKRQTIENSGFTWGKSLVFSQNRDFRR